MAKFKSLAVWLSLAPVYSAAQATSDATATATATATQTAAASTHSVGPASFAWSSSFTYAAAESARYATSVPKPTSSAPTYAPAPESATSLVSALTYSTWGNWKPKSNSTSTASDANSGGQYGNKAWSNLWSLANLPGLPPTSTVYNATVEPTPVPTSQLVLPPADYFGPSGLNCSYRFPPGFIFGVAGAAAQIEGAVADEGRAPAIPELLGLIPGSSNDYVTNENYYYYKQDILRLAAMGVKYYSFSISWTRILPFALPGTPVNKQAIDHYNDVINFVLENGMVPMVTLMHFDPPIQMASSLIGNLDGLSFALGSLGGLGGIGGSSSNSSSPGGLGDIGSLLGGNGSSINVTQIADLASSFGFGGLIELSGLGTPKAGSPIAHNVTFPDAFLNYAKIVMTHYADRVPLWVTINEPQIFSIDSKAIDAVIRGHASVYHFYKEELKGTGNITIKLANNFGVPRNASSEADVYAADWFNSFSVGTFADPIFLGQDYPESFKSLYPNHVPLTADDLAYINGTSDIMSLDYYTGTIVSSPVADNKSSIAACAANATDPLRSSQCVKAAYVNEYGWDIGYRSQSYVRTTPTNLRTYLSYIYGKYRKPVAVTEFGFPVFGEAEKELSDQLYDSPRSVYYLSSMTEILKAIWEDGVDVVGAIAWSFADNWEWGDFKQQFGMQTVNRTSQERHYKKSFFDLVDFVKSRGAD